MNRTRYKTTELQPPRHYDVHVDRAVGKIYKHEKKQRHERKPPAKPPVARETAFARACRVLLDISASDTRLNKALDAIPDMGGQRTRR